jgi:glycine cleavage system regulatory protein
MTLLVLSVVGSDRPGLTQALAAAVLTAGGNWLESQLSQLGGLYVGSVLIELEAGRTEDLRAAVHAVDAHGLEVRIAPAASPASEKDAVGEALQLTLVGQDRPGIVNQVTTVLTTLDANIEALETWVAPEPHSGGPLFHMKARLRLPTMVTSDAVQGALEDISGEVMVDLSLVSAA